MKKFLFLAGLFLFSFSSAFAIEDLENVGIAKYAVIEAKSDYSPIRVAPDVNAARFSHIRKGFVLYADKQNKDFYRVDLGLDKPFWIEKKYSDVQAVIENKHIVEIDEIKFSEDKDKYEIFIPANIQNAYSFKEVPDGLLFCLYDVKVKGLTIKDKRGAFSVIPVDNNILKIKYITPALFGYDVIPHKKGLVVQIKKIPKINRKKPLKGIKVALDAGHGGLESGVCANGLEEKDVNLKIAKQMKKALSKKGAKVYMTRKKDKYVPLYDRVAFANKKEADILISIHQNSLPNPKDVIYMHGAGTYYYNEQSKSLAQNIQKEVLKFSKFRDDGVNYASFALTRPTSPVSVLLECGYLIDKNEAQKLSDKKFQKGYSKAFADGVENYLRYIVVF